MRPPAQGHRNGLGSLAAALLFGAASGPALAEWHGEAKFLTDYFYRGYSLSRGNPVGQGNLDYGHGSGAYAGLTLSQVGFDDQAYGDRAQVQFLPYLGWNLAHGEDWRGDVSVTGYVFDGKVFGLDSDYAEFRASLDYGESLTAQIAYAPDAYGRGVGTLDYEIHGRYDPADDIRLSAGLGYNQAARLLEYDYFFWNAGATWFAHPLLALDLRYVDTDVPAYYAQGPGHANELALRPTRNKVLFSISVGF